jgi:act minimal PKS chain-length factor (CLF/KS beta)
MTAAAQPSPAVAGEPRPGSGPAAPPARTAVTGIGVAAPNGLGLAAWWRATLRGVSGLRPAGAHSGGIGFADRVGGIITDFVPRDQVPARLVPQTARFTQLSLYATAEALADAAADLDALPEYASGVYTASSAGGYEFGQLELGNLWRTGSDSVSAYQSFAWFYAACTGQISIRHGLRGPSGTLVSEQAGGLDAIAQGRRRIREGTELILAGGVDAALCPLGWAGHYATGRLSPGVLPDRAYLPFGRDAAGYVPGEGGAVLVLEEEDAARRRGARVHGVIAGYAATFDAPPDEDGQPPGDGAGLCRAAELALADASLRASDIDVVFADASGVPALDAAEAAALTALFGPYGVPVAAPKSMTGRLGAGGSALDLAAALLALRDQTIPPTVHVERPADHFRLDLVTGSARPAALRHALVLSRGHGGFNAAMVVAAVSPHDLAPEGSSDD